MDIKIGDIVKCPDIWGEKVLFRVKGFFGNDYCRVAVCQMKGKPETIGNRCNIVVQDIVLVDSLKRPMRNISYDKLKDLCKRQISEAIRERQIRIMEYVRK